VVPSHTRVLAGKPDRASLPVDYHAGLDFLACRALQLLAIDYPPLVAGERGVGRTGGLFGTQTLAGPVFGFIGAARRGVSGRSTLQRREAGGLEERRARGR
jgi:hypothetical protein